MYSGAKKTKMPNIYDIAEKITQEEEEKKEAMQIINAYRKVENLHTNSSTQHRKKDEPKKEVHKPESLYANKVKETLREMNANRKKNIDTSKEIQKPIINEKVLGLGSAERHLIQSGLRKLNKILMKKYDQNTKFAFEEIAKNGNEMLQNKDELIRLWKLTRVFNAWRYENMLMIVEKERKGKELAERELKHTKLAIDFHYFWWVKKIFTNWKVDTKRGIKKREIEFEENLVREQEKERIEKEKVMEAKREKEETKQKRITNIELQNKLRGFLNGLKEEVESKQKLNTINENSEEIQIHVNGQTQNDEDCQMGENNGDYVENNIDENAEVEAEAEEEHIEIEQKGPLTNEDLEKRRKELEKKAKSRKEALEKLKKEREIKKKQEEEQRVQLEKEIEDEQKRIRQEQYKKFLKQKREEEEWIIREKELTNRAVEFDRLRIMKYYGWNPWSECKQINCKLAESIGNLMTKIILKRKFDVFVSQITNIGLMKLKESEETTDKIYKRKLLKKCFSQLKQNKIEYLREKEELKIHHEVHLIKIIYREWERARHLIQLENYEWERPRIKKAECLHHMVLLNKVFEGLKINRDEEIQSRKIAEHKAKIKEKLHEIVEEKPTINYDDFL